MNSDILVRGGFKEGSQMPGMCGEITDPNQCIKENLCYWSDYENVARCLPATDPSVNGDGKPKRFLRAGKTNEYKENGIDAMDAMPELRLLISAGCNALENASCTQCDFGETCSAVKCDEGYYDLDSEVSNGCESSCNALENASCTQCDF